MSRFLLSLLGSALVLTSSACALAPTRLAPTTVKPDWQQPDTVLLGFTGGGYLVTRRGNAAGLHILDAATGQQKQTIVFPEVPDQRQINLLAFTPDLQTLAWTNRMGDAVTVRTPQGEWTTPPASGVQAVKRLALSPDGKTLAVATYNSYVQLWDTATRMRQHTLMRMVDPFAFTPDGQTLAATGVFGSSGLTLWNVATGEKRLDLPQLQYPTRPLQFLPGGLPGETRLLAGNTLTRLELGDLPHGDDGVTTRAFSSYVEGCPPGSIWKLCRRDPWTGSASNDGRRILQGIFRTPNFRAAGLLYDDSGKLLKVLDVGEGNLPTLTPDGQRLVWPSRTGDLLSGRLP